MIYFVIYRLMLTAQISAAIEAAPDSAKLTAQERAAYAHFMVEAASDFGVDPWLIAAVAEHESRFDKSQLSRTGDYGLMQVHWQKLHPQIGEDWLVGLEPTDLFDPRTNIRAGARQLAHLRTYCRGKGHGDTHKWWGHYKWGRVIRSPKYGRAILGRLHRLQRSRAPRRTS